MKDEEKEYRFKFLLSSILLNSVGLETFALSDKFIIYCNFLGSQKLSSISIFFEEFLGVEQIWYNFKGFMIKKDFESCYQHLMRKMKDFDFENHKISYFEDVE